MFGKSAVPPPAAPASIIPKVEWPKRLEALAVEAEPAALAAAEGMLASFVEQHDTDVAAYKFQCQRHGDFLAVFITRNTGEAEQVLAKVSHSLNLTNTAAFTLIEGHSPDNRGHLTYTFTVKKDDGDDGGDRIYGWSSAGRTAPPKGRHYVVTPKEIRSVPWNGRRLIQISGTADQNCSSYWYDDSHRIQHRTPNYPRPAEDDQIVFVGVGTIFAPAGCGKAVLNAIHKALAKEQK